MLQVRKNDISLNRELGSLMRTNDFCEEAVVDHNES